ncbi:MAG TPA: metabolite traffic protein EboE [Planctomycetota bacterium]|nr:metabolite traffic protein EboE [Planctomycetota bacterium]
MDLGRLGHLTYCTNIHAGETLAEVRAGLEKHLPPIKAAVSPGRPLGVGLRLGHAAAEGLRDPAALAALKGFLDTGGYYVFTLNGFPYGPFHGRAVKEDAYRPDWSEPERLAYTDHLADVLAALLPANQPGSVSTVPCTFKPWSEGRMDAVVEHLVRHVAHLVGIERRQGKRIALALEPEPYCFLETVDEAVAFFEERLFGRTGVARLAALASLSPAEAESAMRRHLGLCYDVCHAAVEFEDPRGSIDRLRARGIGIYKLQLSAALRVARFGAQSARQLGEFAEPVYLHQVVRRSNGALQRYIDLPQALAEAAGAEGSEWRVHFHVPIFLERMEHFDTTQAFLAEILALHRDAPVSAHLEVETYTWDVLPAAYRGVPLSAAIARELNWVKERLGA